jgi:hypothetical protein
MNPTLKSIAKRILPERATHTLRVLRRLLAQDSYPPVPCDNTYPWLKHTFLELMKDEVCARKPMYVWGVAQGAAQAKVLGIPRISVIEFGVAAGFGLVALEKIAENVEFRTGVGIDVIGFDTGVGLPRPEDVRDQPNMWFGGQLPMDRGALEAALRKAQLRIGNVKETVPSFVESNPAPVAFVSFDLDLYSSTRDSLALFQADYQFLLPRVVSYFDDIFGHSYNEYCGERLAIAEFNGKDSRKICPIYGLRHFIPRSAIADLWPEGMFLAHFFEHPSYGVLDSFHKAVLTKIDGTVVRSAPAEGGNVPACGCTACRRVRVE